MSHLKLYLVGGFLGSGKTTAIIQAAKYLNSKNKRVAVIANDQGTQQVDSRFIKDNGIPSEEVSGGCFCCNYENLEDHIHSLGLNNSPDVIFAESVGSCTDLAATVINPLLSLNPDKYEIVLSVFADIRLLTQFLKKEENIFYDNVNYIYEKQLEEADIIVVNKIDLLNEEQLTFAKKIIDDLYSDKIVHYQNSFSNESISKWLDIIKNDFHNISLRSTPEMDYDIYGAGEAELAWLDEEIGIITKDKNAVAAGYILINCMYTKLKEHNYPIGHLKFLMDDGKEHHKISFNSIGICPVVDVPNNIKTDRIIILINARVQVKPDLLQKIMAESIIETEISCDCKIIENNTSVFKPSYPRPTHRISA